MAKKFKKIMLDTNIIINIIRGNKTEIEKVNQIPFESLCISTITILEVLYGMTKKEQTLTKRQLKALYEIEPESLDFRKSKELMFAHSGYRPQLADCMIASQCLNNNCILYTNNRKDFDYLDVELLRL